jgi:phenolic acid decarboxylase
MASVAGVSCWDEPTSFDVDAATEFKDDQARNLLLNFYTKFNPAKLQEVNDILSVYKNNYTELFISLANKYEMEDLSMFAGVTFD